MSSIKIIFNRPVVEVKHTVVSSSKRIVRNQKTGYIEEIIVECQEDDVTRYIYSIDASLHAEYILDFQDTRGRKRLDRWVNEQLQKLVQGD